MTASPPPISRSDWEAVISAFATFFAGLGHVRVDEEVAEFSSDETGFHLRRDGTSRSFMPLHELGARWEEIVFDREAHAVELRAAEMSYRYLVPRRLLSLRGESS